MVSLITLQRKEKVEIALNCGNCAEPFPIGEIKEFHRGQEYAGDTWETYRCIAENCFYITTQEVGPIWNLEKDEEFARWIEAEIGRRQAELSSLEVVGLPEEITRKAESIVLSKLVEEHKEKKFAAGKFFYQLLNNFSYGDWRDGFGYRPRGLPIHIDCIDDAVEVDRRSMIEILAKKEPQPIGSTGERYVQLLLTHRPDLKGKYESARDEIDDYLTEKGFFKDRIYLLLGFWDYDQRKNNHGKN